MGKSVRQTQDPFAYKPEYNNQVGTAIPKPAENDPFAFKPEYNNQVKKNVGAGGLETSSPTQLQSQSGLPEETATDFLTKDIEANDFVSKAVSNTDVFFPETAIKRRNQEIAQQTKIDVLSNPVKLAQYTADRITTLKDKLKSLKTQQSQLTSLGEPGEGEAFGAFSGQSIVSDKKKYNELSQQILDTSNYIHKLKNNVANIASDFVVSQEDPKTLNPKSVGRKIVGIADPDLDEQMKVIEKAGGVLPGIRAEEMERIGLNATKSYLSRQPDVPQKQQLLNLVNSYESDFEERNYLTTAMRVREKIGAQIYKDGNQVRGAWFGLGYPNWQLKEIIDNPQTGLSDAEKKVALNYVLPLERKIIGTDIPTSGFTRSFYNAIEKSAVGTGKSLGDITGIRTEADVAGDLLSQEADQSRYRAPGEGPTPQAQLAYLNQKGKLTSPEINQKKELENYVNVRSGWSKFKDGVGDLTGQVAQMALLTKGLGAGGKLLQAVGAEGGLLGGMTTGTVGAALSSDMVGLVVNGYLNSYDNYKQQALSLMPGESKAGARDAYAKTMATVEGLSEMIFPDTKVLKAFTSKLAPAVKDITSKLISQEITQQVAKEEFQSAISQYLKPFAKEFAKSELQESTEEAVVDLAQGVADSVFGGQQFDISKTGNQALNTFLTAMLYSPLVSGMAAHGAHRQNQSQNAFVKSAIVDMAANPAAYLKSVEDLQLSGEITQTQANEKVSLIKSANNYLQEIPASRLVEIKTGEGEAAQTSQQNKPMDFPEVSSYLLHRMNEGILQQQIDNSTDEVLKSKLEKDVKRSQEIRKGIFDGSIGVTPDLQDVTDNPKKSEELGIADATQVLPEQLTGTPFQKMSSTKNGDLESERADIEKRRQQELSSIKYVEHPNIKGQFHQAETEGGQLILGERRPDVINSINAKYDEELSLLKNKSAQNENAQPASTESEATAQAPISEDQKKAIIDQAKPAIEQAVKDGIIKGGQADMVEMVLSKNDPVKIEQFLKDVADQALSKVSPDANFEESDGYKEAVNNYSEPVVKLATQLFPITQNIQSNESKISQESATQKVSQETGKQQEGQNAGQENDEKGNVLNEPGAQPEAAAPLPASESGAPMSGITHAQTEETRKEFGLGDSYEKTVRKDAELVAQADEEIKKGYNIEELVSKVEKGTIPTDLENTIIKKYKAGLEAQIAKDPSDENINKLKRLVQATDKIGSETGRALRSRQGMEFRDDSLAGFFIQDINANLQAPLTDQQKETVIKEHEAIAGAQAKYDAKIEALEAENAKLRAEQAIKKQKPATKKEKKTHEDYVQERKDLFEAAREKLRKLRGESQVTIVPYANELFAIAPEVGKLVKSLVAEGISGLAEITKTVYDTFKEIVPDLTDADVNNIIAGEYNEKQKTKSEIAGTLRDLRDEAALINKLDTLLNGEEPKDERKKIARNQQIEQLRKKIKGVRADIAESEKFFGESDVAERKLESLKDELDRIEKRKSKEKIAKGSVEEKEISDREKELRDKIEKAQAEWDKEKEAAKQMSADYRKLETERNRQLKRVSDLSDKLSNLQKGIKNEPVNKETKKDTPEIEALKKEVAEAEKQLNKTIATQKRVSDLEVELKRLQDRKEKEPKEVVKREITDREKQLRSQIEAERKAVEKETQAIALKTLKSRTKSEIAKVEEQLKTGNFAKEETKEPLKLDKEAAELKDKLIKLRQERLVRLIKQEYASRSKLRKAFDAVANVLNVPRSLMASVDFSAPLRQAAIVTVANPKTAAIAGLEMFKQAFSQKRFDRWFYDLQESPRYALMQQSGLYVADPHDPRLSAKEEQFMSNLAEKIPLVGKLVRGSERAYVSYLNKMRVDLFNRYTDALENDGFTWENHPEMYNGLASFLNNSTGRGELGPLETAAPMLNATFFSPRLMASRINILGLNPAYYAKLPPKIRKEALKSLAIFIGAGVSTLYLLSLSFGCKDDDKDKDCLHVELDPRSSDFGKVISGKTRWDIWGGFQQYVRIVVQLVTGQAKSVNSGKINDLDGEGLFKRTRADQLFAFFRAKLAPVPSFIIDRLAGRNVIGQKQTLTDAAVSRLTPLVAADLYTSIKEDGVKAIFTQGIPSTFGVGVQNYLPQGYDDKNIKDPVFKFLYDKNLSLHEPAQTKEMSDEQYSKFLKDRSAIIKEEWQQAIQYGIMINEKGNPTIDEDAAIKIIPADKATYEQLTGLMKSITAKATRDVHKQAAEQ